MPKFEVFIPAAQADFPNVTFRVDASNWMAALKIGMEKLGEQGTAVGNLLVDIKEDKSIHVTDPTSARVFRIREITDREAATAQEKRPTPAPVPPKPRGKVEEVARAVDVMSVRGKPEATRAPAPAPAVPSPPRGAPPGLSMRPTQVVELEKPTQAVTGRIGRVKPQGPLAPSPEDLLSDAFERVQELHKKGSPERVFNFLLDLALEKIPAEAGSVFSAHARTGDLTFAAVRGPKAQEIIAAKIVIPAGTGIAGFCAVEGVSVALSDVQKDPRYYAAVAEKVSYATRSVLCSPMMAGGRNFGCMEIINKKDGAVFSEAEVSLLAYVAHQGALYLQAR